MLPLKRKMRRKYPEIVKQGVMSKRDMYLGMGGEHGKKDGPSRENVFGLNHGND